MFERTSATLLGRNARNIAPGSFVESAMLTLIALSMLCAADAPPALPFPVRARLEVESAIQFAGEPILVRFALINDGDAPVELELRDAPPAPAGAAVVLSDHHIFNTDAGQGVWVAAPDSPRLELSRKALVLEPGPTDLTLGPKTTIARELDLAAYVPRMAVPGVYEIVWRPYGGRLGSNALRIRVIPRKEVVLSTDAGEIVLEPLYRNAPQTCLHFVKLVESGFYDGLLFHRVGKGSLIQGGGLDLSRKEKTAATVPAEFNDTPHIPGVVSMARRFDPLESADDPPRKAFADSARSQFFICLNKTPEWDGRFTAFARVSKGLEIVVKISESPADEAGFPAVPVVIRKATVRPAPRASSASPKNPR